MAPALSGRSALGAAALAALCAAASGLAAQDLTPLPRPADLAYIESPPAGAYGPAELDAMLGPVALYPDALLTQVLVASTVPLDLVRADRWIAENADLAPEAREEAAASQGWDESVAILAAGFPVVAQRMAADLDRTEALGDAVMLQTDDVLAAIQRLRGQAEANGFLDSNEAQVVSVEDGQIAIAPADPQVVYVPSYDPQTVYFQPATAPPTYVSEPVYYDDDPDWNAGGVVAAGAIAFGAALVIDEIFDDDDDWHGYWGPDEVHIDWDDGQIYDRPDRDIDIEGDVNIDRDRVRIDRGDVDLDRTDFDAAAARARIGDRDPHRDREHWTPDPARREAARDKLAARAPAGDRPAAEALRAGGGALAGAGGAAARDRLEAASARRPPAAARPGASHDIFRPEAGGAAAARAARDRGGASLGVERGGGRHGARPEAHSRSRPIAAPSQARRPPQALRSQHPSAFERPHGGGGGARAATSRGMRSHGGGGGRGGGGRRR